MYNFFILFILFHMKCLNLITYLSTYLPIYLSTNLSIYLSRDIDVQFDILFHMKCCKSIY